MSASDSRQSGSKLDDQRLTEEDRTLLPPRAGDGGPGGNRQEAGLQV